MHNWKTELITSKKSETNLEGKNLVLHEWDERCDHEGQARWDDRWQLVGQTFTSTWNIGWFYYDASSYVPYILPY